MQNKILLNYKGLNHYQLCALQNFQSNIKNFILNFSYCVLQFDGEVLELGYNQIQHFLYFLPLPQGQGSFRPTFA